MTKKGRRGSAIRNPPKPAGTTVSTARDPAQLLVALAGLAVTAVLLWGAQAGGGLPYCSAGSGCDVVQSSAWSKFLGLPLALWGFGSYLALGAAALQGARRRRRACAAIAIVGFAVSVYLTAVSYFVIGALCAYCLVSLALMTLAFALTWRPAERAGTGPTRVAAVMAGLVIAAVMHASATGMLGGAGPVDPDLKALAQHLEQRGFKFYGASWCPHCQEQKALFGAAARFLPYVECSPHGPKSPRATECEMRDIRNYPTWLVDNRRIERVLPVKTLRTMSGFDAGLP